MLDTGTLCNMRRVTAAEWPHVFRSLDQDEPVVITDYRANQHGSFRRICHRDELLRRCASLPEPLAFLARTARVDHGRHLECAVYWWRASERAQLAIEQECVRGRTWTLAAATAATTATTV